MIIVRKLEVEHQTPNRSTLLTYPTVLLLFYSTNLVSTIRHTATITPQFHEQNRNIPLEANFSLFHCPNGFSGTLPHRNLFPLFVLLLFYYCSFHRVYTI